MFFKNFDKFSSVLRFSTLKLLLFSCRKSLRFFSAHVLKLCVFSQKCAWKTQIADQKLSLQVHNRHVIYPHTCLKPLYLYHVLYLSIFRHRQVTRSLGQCTGTTPISISLPCTVSLHLQASSGDSKPRSVHRYHTHLYHVLYFSIFRHRQASRSLGQCTATTPTSTSTAPSVSSTASYVKQKSGWALWTVFMPSHEMATGIKRCSCPSEIIVNATPSTPLVEIG